MTMRETLPIKQLETRREKSLAWRLAPLFSKNRQLRNSLTIGSNRDILSILHPRYHLIF